MKATRLVAPGEFDVVELPLPVAGPGEAVVRVGAVSICGSDLSAYLGRHPRIVPPVILGHECSGVVESIGDGVEGLSVGTRAAVEPTIGCRSCAFCRSGRENICPHYTVLGESVEHPGAFAGRILVAADHVHPIPDTISFAVAAMVQPLAVGLHAVRDRGRVQAGEVAFVVGAGPIGMAVIIAAHAAGARVIAADVLPSRLELARRMGAEIVIDANTDDSIRIVRDETSGLGSDVSFDCAGGVSVDPLHVAIRATSRGGRVVMVGSYKEPVLPIPVGVTKYGEIDLLGSIAHPNSFREVIRRIAAGELHAQELASHTFGFDDVRAAFSLLAGRRQQAMKVVLVPEEHAAP